ncbi:SpoIIE family protein phosphatase [Streptacidiphilus sp. MAP12-20]|uniref:SpoIIE family protein phosphatase n=1 Tax=Streptacidiphilus sp. MAP12-20 TaxID=3156299 RepID=UPI00351152AF
MPGEDRSGVGDAFLEALFAQAPVGLFVFDPDLRVVRFNRAGEGVRGLPEDAVLGHTVAEFAAVAFGPEVPEAAARVLASGETLRDRLFHGFRVDDPERRMAVSVTAFRLSDPAGRVLGLAAVVQDVTEREAALERLGLHNEANRLIGSSLDVVTTARELAEVAVPRFADAVLVDLVAEVVRGDRPAAGPRADEAVLYRVVDQGAPAHPDQQDAAADSSVLPQPYPSAYAEAMVSLGPVLLESPSKEHNLPLRARSALVAPLLVQGHLLGLATFVRSDRPDAFAAADLDLATALVGRTALSLDKALAYMRERDVATSLQRHLLPRVPPRLSAVDCAHVHHHGAEAADWFDVIPLSGARVALVMGTVAGRGIETAAAMGQLRTAVQTLAAQDLAPEELLTRLDEATDRLAESDGDSPGEGRPRGSPASCLYLLYDPTTGRCTAASAGHPGPVVLGPDGQPIPFAVPVGPFLGEGGPFESSTTELPPDTLLALHTTGLSPATSSRASTNRQRLLSVLTYPGPSLEQLCEAASALLAPVPAEDRTLLLARTHVLGPEHLALWTLPPEPTVVSTARHLARRQLEAWHLEHLQDTTELIISELVTNAIRYGTGPVTVRLIHDQSLTCEVSDAGKTAPHLRRAHANDEGAADSSWSCTAAAAGAPGTSATSRPSGPNRAHTVLEPADGMGTGLWRPTPSAESNRTSRRWRPRRRPARSRSTPWDRSARSRGGQRRAGAGCTCGESAGPACAARRAGRFGLSGGRPREAWISRWVP